MGRRDREEQLESFRVKSDQAWLQDRSQRVPDRIRDKTASVAEIALSRKRNRSNEAITDSEFVAAGKELEGLSDRERTELFGAIFPKLATALDRAWHDLPRRAAFIEMDSYFGARVPFRAGSAKRHISYSRAVWFQSVVRSLIGFDPDPEWLAAWVSHLSNYDGHLSALLAGAIDAGGKSGEAVLEALKLSSTNSHSVGEMSFSVIQALLISARPEAWDFVADLLLNGSREEGLRQAILESIHECHPDAFIRILHLIMEERLVRFSSVVRAADVWFGLRWDSIGPAVIQKQIERAYLYLTDTNAREKALTTGSGEEAYMALWCVAFRDLGAAAKRASDLVKDKDPERRFAAVSVARIAGASEFIPTFIAALGDGDDRVVAGAVRALSNVGVISAPIAFKSESVFDALAPVFDRAAAGTPKELAPIIWPWTVATLSPQFVGEALTRFVPESRAEEMIPRLARLGPNERRQIAAGIGAVEAFRSMYEGERKHKKPRPISVEARTALLSLLGDASTDTREVAFRALSLHPVTPEERDRIEELLSRKASDLRTKGIERLLAQDDGDALASAARLLDATSVDQQLAGAEILTQMAGKKRAVDRVAAAATRASESTLQASKKKPDARVTALLESARKADVILPTLRDCLGLLPPERALIPPSSVPKPRAFQPLMMTREAIELTASLDALVEKHKDLPIAGTKDFDDSSKERVIGGMHSIWHLPNRYDEDEEKDDSDENKALGPLGRIDYEEIWTEWWDEQRSKLGENSHKSLLLARLAMDVLNHLGWKYEHTKWPKGFQPLTPKGRPRPPKHDVVEGIMSWLLAREGTLEDAAPMLDQAERALALDRFIDPWANRYQRDDKPDPRELLTSELIMPFSWWRHMWYLPTLRFNDAARVAAERRVFQLHRIADALWPEHYDRVIRGPLEEARAQNAARDVYESYLDSDFDLPRPSLSSIAASIQDGLADEFDVIRYAIHRHEGEKWRDRTFGRWRKAATKSFSSGPRRCETVVNGLQRAIARAVEVELGRGDTETAATPIVKAIELFEGAGIALRALAALKERSLKRGYLWSGDRSTSLSRMIVFSLPLPEDTDTSFSGLARDLDIPEARLVELALYAPQWAGHVERHLGWTGLEDASWWVHAHAKNTDEHMWGEEEVRAVWLSRMTERTVVDREDFKDGAVDRAWFLRTYKALGEKRWSQVYALAKAAAAGANHKRAQTFADAILGRTKSADLKKAIATKRAQDAARALGLVPLPSGDAGRKELKDRYLTMQEMRRTSRKHGGSMLQASEKRAVEIGLENLARTAGYADPQRLQWAMEIEASGDLGEGQLTKKSGDITVTLAIDETGAASITCEKKGKRLASIPAPAKKAPEIAELLERSRELKKQKSRVRQSLEAAMCRGDAFTGAELRTLCAHPVLRPMLERLLLVSDGSSPRLGFAESGATRLRDMQGKPSALRDKESFRIAHPHDLLESGNWSGWQRECFTAERIQPFKQVFRELYIPTPAEKKGKSESTRYAGHQVQPRQAVALLGSRGWVVRPDDGVQRTFHHERVRAFLSFDETFYTPAEVEGLTVQSITFRPLGSHDQIKLTDVPPRVFCEVMRDVDLAVSVAHRGGVDPEASESTIESRASLARETCALLKHANVKIKNAHAIIKGERGDYSVHLGSGVIHMLPGGSIEVVAVGAYHRGRLFLPFADEDPKTAEVLSKILLFARDGEIRDPFILEQIRSR